MRRAHADCSSWDCPSAWWRLAHARPSTRTDPARSNTCAPSQLSKLERYRDLISISVVHTLNAALCEWHAARCPPSEQLRTECAKARALYEATKAAVRELDADFSCSDQLVRTAACGGVWWRVVWCRGC
jgi:hypothetical protein